MVCYTFSTIPFLDLSDSSRSMLWATIRYGDRMRAWVDIGYSTAQTN